MSAIPPARRSRTSSPPAGMREFSPWPPSAPPAATTSGSRSVRSAWRCEGSLVRHCERSEAIHLPKLATTGLLRRFAPRNDENEQSHHILSTVDRERRAGDGARLVSGKEHHGAGDFF